MPLIVIYTYTSTRYNEILNSRIPACFGGWGQSSAGIARHPLSKKRLMALLDWKNDLYRVCELDQT